MPTTPVTSVLGASTGVFDNAYGALQAKYADAGSWATWAASLLDSTLTKMTATNDSFTVADLIAAFEDAIATLPTYTPGTLPAFSGPVQPTFATVPAYNAPQAPTYPSIPTYSAPSDPVYTAVPGYTAPQEPTYFDIPGYDAPTKGTLLSPTDPTLFTVGSAPVTTLSYSSGQFSDPLLTALENALTGYLATQSTGLGNAETALFARETARASATRAAAYAEITNQFASRGWDMPIGALLAKQTEMNNESTTRLADSSAAIMAESARLAVQFNIGVISSSAQVADILARIYDSEKVRELEKAKTEVLFAVEAFKNTIAAGLANAQLEAAWQQNVAAYNQAIVQTYLGEIQGEIEPIKGLVSSNSTLAQAFMAAVQAAIAPMTGVTEANKAVAGAYAAAVQGAIAPVTGAAEANRSIAAAYSAAVQGAIAPVTATVQENAVIAQRFATEVSAATEVSRIEIAQEQATGQAYELSSRKALSLAQLAGTELTTLVDAAIRQFMVQVEAMKSIAQSSAQLIASALGSVNVSAAYGAHGQYSESLDVNENAGQVKKSESTIYEGKV